MRAGRGLDSEAFVLFYALNNPWDKFHAANLSEFVSRKLDEIVLDPNNEVAIEEHLPCLLYESEYRHESGDNSILGKSLSEKLKKNLVGIEPPPPGYKPLEYQTLGMRGSMGKIYRLMKGRQEIGSISEARKFREAYLGAVFLHDGEKYRVEGHGQEVVNLGGVEEHLKTDPIFYTTVTQERIFGGNKRSLDLVSITAMYASLAIGENFSGYNLINEIDNEVIKKHRDNVARTFQRRHAFILTLENCEHATSSAIAALEQLFRIGAMFIIPADRHDTDTYSVDREKSVYLYENYKGGIGVAKKMLDKWVDVLKTGKEIALNCRCKQGAGCPNCIMPPRSNNQMNKKEGIALADEIMEVWKNNSVAKKYFDPKKGVFVTQC